MSNKIVKSLLAAGALGAALVVLTVVATSDGGDPPPAGPSAQVVGISPPELRTVLVADARMPAPSPAGTRLHALRVSGQVPGRPSTATVLTDEDCAADARGISHCLNRVRLASGATLSVRHPHRMMEVPCLSPGERVMVRPA